MDYLEAQALIAKQPRFNKSQLYRLEPMKVDYESVDDMLPYKQKRLATCIDWIVKTYKPDAIYLVRSQLNGHPVDEYTNSYMFNLKKEIYGDKAAKFSDWDFVIDGGNLKTWNEVTMIEPLIKIDVFRVHHGGCRKLKIYEKA